MKSAYRVKVIVGILTISLLLSGCSSNNQSRTTVTVQGSSMEPTLYDGEQGYSEILEVEADGPQRGDIVVLTEDTPHSEYKYKEPEGIDGWIKRVIGLPGETIEGKNGQVFINGEVLDESSYLPAEFINHQQQVYREKYGFEYDDGKFTSDFNPITLGDDEYFVMGDNRIYSKDSRFPDIGPIKKNQIASIGFELIENSD